MKTWLPPCIRTHAWRRRLILDNKSSCHMYMSLPLSCGRFTHLSCMHTILHQSIYYSKTGGRNFPIILRQSSPDNSQIIYQNLCMLSLCFNYITAWNIWQLSVIYNLSHLYTDRANASSLGVANRNQGRLIGFVTSAWHYRKNWLLIDWQFEKKRKKKSVM